MSSYTLKWKESCIKKLSEAELLMSSRRSEFDSTRAARQGKRQDPMADRQENIKTKETVPPIITPNIKAK